MTGFFPALGGAVVRLRWVVLALWIVFVGLSFLGVRGLSKKLVSGNLNVPGSESARGVPILEEEFGRQPTRAAIAVFTSDRLTLDSPQSPFCEGVNRELAEVRAVEGVGQIVSYCDTSWDRFVTTDRHTTYALVNFAGSEEDAKNLIPTVREAMERGRAEQVKSYLTGYAATAYDLSEGSKHALEKGETIGLPLALIVLLVVFGSIIAAGLPALLGAASAIIALAGLGIIAQRMETSIFAMNTVSMIGLALGIDFSLLMVSRFREELARGQSSGLATMRTVATAGQSIVFSGLTVILGVSMVLLYDLVLLRSIAIGMILVVSVAVLAAVTLLPALLCLLGHRINSLTIIPGRKKKLEQVSRPGRWHAWSMLVMRNPWPFMILSLIVLLGLAYPAKELNAIGVGGPFSVEQKADARVGFEVLTRPEPAGLPIGDVFPISVVVRTGARGGAFDPTIKEGVFKLTQRLADDDRVARVESLANIRPNLTLDQFKGLTAEQLGADPNQKRAVAQLVNIDRGQDTYLVTVISKFRDTDERTTNLLKDIRSSIAPSIRELRGADVLVTGSSALTLDYRDKLYGQFPLLVGLVMLVTYLVLLLFFHSLLLPLKAILMNLVAIGAAYGVMVMVFQWGVVDDLFGFEHPGRLTMFPPILLFSVLFGLSTDYEVFLLSRVKERFDATRDNEKSVAEGLELTAGIITAAGLIMVIIYGSFALAEVLVVKELGVGQAVAVFLDSTIIRVMLVPASMRLMGSLNWWMPKWLNWVPTLNPEGAEAVPHRAAPSAAPASAARAIEGQMARCSMCGLSLPARAKFCGRCGTPLARPKVAAVSDMRMGDGIGETLVDVRYGAGRPAAASVDRGLAQGLPASATGLMRVPIALRIGNTRRPAYLILRDCQVERDPSTPSVPVVAIEGVQVMPLQGEDPPEIQVRNARVRL